MSLGKKGEELAAVYLEEKGYRIKKRNYRIRSGEVDLIAEKDGVLCFVEVKTRRNFAYGQPAEAVTDWKKQRLVKAVRHYLTVYNKFGQDVRIDVIEVIMENCTGRIHHIENALWGYEPCTHG